jgi:hypothetical protein
MLPRRDREFMTKTLLSRASLAAKVYARLRQTGFGDDLDAVQIVGPVKLARCNWTIGTLPANADCAIALNRVVADLQNVYDLRASTPADD